jgi:hypothetical protein
VTPSFKRIKQVELVERIFGTWPSFHDAEIHTILLTRDCDSGPRMDVTVHHWQMTSELDSKGYFVLIHHTLTTLSFSGIIKFELFDFNPQNVLFDLVITEISQDGSDVRFSVSMPTSYGCEASFKCREIRVLSAVPFTKS